MSSVDAEKGASVENLQPLRAAKCVAAFFFCVERNGANVAYVLNLSSGNVSVIDLSHRTVIGDPIAVGYRPGNRDS